MVFDYNTISFDLINKAQAGCRESLTTLTELVKDDLAAYLVRLTLNPHLSEDLCQETMLEIVKHLPNLDIPSTRAFWGWLYKTALSKASHHFRRKKPLSLNHDLLDRTTLEVEQAPPQRLMQKELTLTIYEAISSLKISYRNVIALRCFEQLSYTEIAGITGGTQLQAKLRFFRTKKALARRLKKNHFKESHLLPALGLFAALTAQSAKASFIPLSVSAASLEVGLGASVLSMAISKVGLVVGTSLAIALWVTVGRNDTGFGASEPSSDVLTHIIKDIDYAYPVSVSQAYDPDGDDWQRIINVDNRRWIETIEPEAVLIHDRTLPGSRLVLPANHWIQVEFAKPLSDEPGVDLFLSGYGLESKPHISLVSPDNEQLELVPTLTRDQPSGFTVMAYDLAEAELSFQPSKVRATAIPSEVGTRPFELRMIRARLSLH